LFAGGILGGEIAGHLAKNTIKSDDDLYPK
jgi:hypothetical protein